MTDPAADPLIGKVLNGRFRILAPLGVGGMGRVYKAMQSPLDRMVALKVLNPRYGGSSDPGFERRFFLEAAMTAKLHHPNTVTVHDYGRTDDGIFFIAMECIEGQTLQQLLTESGSLPWPRVMNIAGQICRSLREAHKMGVVHRDLKPANVMVLHEDTGSDRVKVLDFGLVKPFLPDGPLSPSETDITQAGVLLGSPLYMAPEQARSLSDPRSDVYSLGVLLFQCLSGKPPFFAKESIDIIVKHIREPPPKLSALVPELPAEVDALVMKCLEKAPEQRFQSMDELLDALKAIAQRSGISGFFSDSRSGVHSAVHLATGAHQPDAPRSLEVELSFGSVSKRRKATLIGVGVAAVLVGVAGAYFATREPSGVEEVHPQPRAVAPLPSVEPSTAPAVDDAALKEPEVVSFSIRSEPSGASVLDGDGNALGQTPLTLQVNAQPDHHALAELTFSLEGYQPLALTAQGAAPTVEVNATLRKKTSASQSPKKKHAQDNGEEYKEDPY